MLARRSLSLVAALAAVLGASAGSVASSTAFAHRSAASTGTLALNAELRISGGSVVTCPPGVPGQALECIERTGSGVVPGLGSVSESYIWVDDQASPACPGERRVLPMTAQLVVAQKGVITLAVDGLDGCLASFGLLSPPARSFTIIGGTGAYSGASGNGMVSESVTGLVGPTVRGRDTWAGTLVVPGLDFDVTPPVLGGAVGKTVRVRRGTKSVRVSYNVTAHDDQDGPLPVSCTPRSGSRFMIGRTTVTCSATDTSGNTATRRFRITVRTR